MMYKLIAGIAAGFFAFIIWIIYLANTGGRNVLFDFVRSVPNGDKVGHFLLFGVLTLVVNLALKLRTLNLHYFRMYIGTILVSLFVVLEELSQVFIPSRTFELEDLTADAIGIMLFTLATYAIAKCARSIRSTRKH